MCLGGIASGSCIAKQARKGRQKSPGGSRRGGRVWKGLHRGWVPALAVAMQRAGHSLGFSGRAHPPGLFNLPIFAAKRA